MQTADVLKLTAYHRFALPSIAHPESANAYVTIANRHFYDPACLDTSKPAIPALRRNSKSHAACLADAAAVVTASYKGMLAQSSTFSTPKVRIPPQVPNAGRGLAPVEPFQQGTIIHSEKPMLCFPPLKHVAKVWPSTSTYWAALAWVKILDSADPVHSCTLDQCVPTRDNCKSTNFTNMICLQVCHHCLTPLQSRQASISALRFCSKACETSSFAYSRTEKLLDLSPLSEYCMEHEEQFPLLLARAACMHLSKQLQPIERHLSSSPAAKQQSSNASQGDIWQVQFVHHLRCSDILFAQIASLLVPQQSNFLSCNKLLT